VIAPQPRRQWWLRMSTEEGAAKIILGGRFGEEPSQLSWQRLDRFVEAGGRAVDTAHSYADGRSEQVIGEWMRANPGKLVVVDKIGYPDDIGAVDLSPHRLRGEVAESCRRLSVSTLDPYPDRYRDRQWQRIIGCHDRQGLRPNVASGSRSRRKL